MMKRTFEAKGMDYVSDLALLNSRDIIKILEWNRQHGIKLFRLSSSIIPWGNNIDISELKDYKEIKSELKKAGDFAKFWDMRITCHPGPFVVLTSPKDNVVDNALSDLEMHGKLFDMMELSKTPYNKINIHVGATYKDKAAAIKQFLINFETLEDKIKSRLTLENDDKGSLYSVEDLYNMVFKETGTPIVFDYHHHSLHPAGTSERDAIHIAASTWNNIKPVVHYSESRSIEQNIKCPAQAHSDYIYKYIDTHGLDVDIMIEAKMKELALFKYRELHNA
jgi:UV DNA damage endonuclease